MTREIKFRAFVDGEMWENFWLFNDEGKGALLKDTALTLEPVDCAKPYVLMQYTGLKDQNGKEIYEGDVVALNDTVLTHVEPFVVEWDVKKARYDFNGLRTDLKWEVIGNVYENPELLNV